jgi:hypothetical protein
VGNFLICKKEHVYSYANRAQIMGRICWFLRVFFLYLFSLVVSTAFYCTGFIQLARISPAFSLC